MVDERDQNDLLIRKDKTSSERSASSYHIDIPTPNILLHPSNDEISIQSIPNAGFGHDELESNIQDERENLERFLE